MTSITYVGGSERVTWHGHAFMRDKAMDVDHDALIEAAKKNRFFKVSGSKGETHEPSVFDRGAAAKSAGKARSVPPVYRGKATSEEWLNGYDSVEATESE